MARATLIPLLVVFIAVFGSGCTAIKGIFEAGAWVGGLAVLIGLGLLGGLVWLVSRLFKH